MSGPLASLPAVSVAEDWLVGVVVFAGRAVLSGMDCPVGVWGGIPGVGVLSGSADGVLTG